MEPHLAKCDPFYVYVSSNLEQQANNNKIEFQIKSIFVRCFSIVM